jgi:alpha-N-arabinofuranosidase
VYDTKRFGEVPVVDAVATHLAEAEGADELTVLAVNRHQSENVELALDLRAFPGYTPVEHSVLSDPDLRATNTPNDPHRVRPHTVDAGPVTDGRLTVTLPAVSWNVIRLRRTAG